MNKKESFLKCGLCAMLLSVGTAPTDSSSCYRHGAERAPGGRRMEKRPGDVAHQ